MKPQHFVCCSPVRLRYRLPGKRDREINLHADLKDWRQATVGLEQCNELATLLEKLTGSIEHVVQFAPYAKCFPRRQGRPKMLIGMRILVETKDLKTAIQHLEKNGFSKARKGEYAQRT